MHHVNPRQRTPTTTSNATTTPMGFISTSEPSRDDSKQSSFGCGHSVVNEEVSLHGLVTCLKVSLEGRTCQIVTPSNASGSVHVTKKQKQHDTTNNMEIDMGAISIRPVSISSLVQQEREGKTNNVDDMNVLRERVERRLIAEASKTHSALLQSLPPSNMESMFDNWHQEYMNKDFRHRQQMIKDLATSYVSRVCSTKPNEIIEVVSGEHRGAMVSKMVGRLLCFVKIHMKDDRLFQSASAMKQMEAVEYVALGFVNRLSMADAKKMLGEMVA